MRGHLYKKVMPNTWYVAYTADDFGFHKTELPLHPNDVKFLEDCNLVFDNTEARVAVNSDVEFEIVDEFTHPELYTIVGWGDGIKYAKLIPSKEQQKQLITEIMDLDAKDGLYDTTKETLYTEEDMLNAFYDGWLSKDLIWKVAKKLFKESLKQPKKD